MKSYYLKLDEHLNLGQRPWNSLVNLNWDESTLHLQGYWISKSKQTQHYLWGRSSMEREILAVYLHLLHLLTFQFILKFTFNNLNFNLEILDNKLFLRILFIDMSIVQLHPKMELEMPTIAPNTLTYTWRCNPGLKKWSGMETRHLSHGWVTSKIL